MKLSKITFILSIILIFLQSYVPLRAPEAQTAFEEFSDEFEMPDGAATDTQGKLYLHFETTRATELAQLSPTGMILDQERFGSGLFDRERFLGSRFDLDPDLSLNVVVMVTSDGEFIQIHPTSDGFLVAPRSAIQPEEVITDNVYDIHLAQTVPFGILPESLRYGDIALFRSAGSLNEIEVYVTGVSQNTNESPSMPRRPFVMRLIADSQLGIIEAEIVLISSAEIFASDHITRGIAVNRQGVVLTTLPILAPGALAGETIDMAVMFSTAAVLSTTFTPTLAQSVFLLDGLDLSSPGMTADLAGNFYIATTELGSSVCEPDRSGALVVLPVDALTGQPLLQAEDAATTTPMPSGAINQPTCFPVTPMAAVPANSRDVTVSPVDNSVYVTLNILNRVVRAPALVPLP